MEDIKKFSDDLNDRLNLINKTISPAHPANTIKDCRTCKHQWGNAKYYPCDECIQNGFKTAVTTYPNYEPITVPPVKDMEAEAIIGVYSAISYEGKFVDENKLHIGCRNLIRKFCFVPMLIGGSIG